MEFLVPAIIAIVANILDSVTTEIALNRLPVELRAKEANPINRDSNGNVSLLSHAVKQLLVIVIVGATWKAHDLFSIWWIGITLVCVVLSNAYVIIARLITRRKVMSPIHHLFQILHVPHWFEYFGMVAILLGISWLIVTYIILR